MIRNLTLSALFILGVLHPVVSQEPPPITAPNGFTIGNAQGQPIGLGGYQFSAQPAPGGFTFQSTHGEQVLETGTAVEILPGVYSYRTERSQGLFLWNYQERHYQIIRLVQDKKYPERTLIPNP